MITPSTPSRPAWAVGLAFILGIAVFLLAFNLISRYAPLHEPLTPPDKRPAAGALEVNPLPAADGSPAQPWRLADHRGQVVLVNYFATWCPPCNAELPDLRELARQFAPRGVAIAFISLDAPADRDPPQPIEPLLRQFAKDRDLPFPILLPNPNLSLMLEGTSIPQTFLYDRQGRRARSILGAINQSDVAQSLEELLKEPQEKSP